MFFFWRNNRGSLEINYSSSSIIEADIRTPDKPNFGDFGKNEI